MTALLKVVFIEYKDSQSKRPLKGGQSTELFQQCQTLLVAHNYKVYETPKPKPFSFNVTLNHQPVYSRQSGEKLPTADNILRLVKKEKRRQLNQMYALSAKQAHNDFCRSYLGQSPSHLPIVNSNRRSPSTRWSVYRQPLSREKELTLFKNSISTKQLKTIPAKLIPRRPSNNPEAKHEPIRPSSLRYFEPDQLYLQSMKTYAK